MLWMEYHLTSDSTVSTGLLKPAEDKVVLCAQIPELADPESRHCWGRLCYPMIIPGPEWQLPALSCLAGRLARRGLGCW